MRREPRVGAVCQRLANITSTTFSGNSANTQGGGAFFQRHCELDWLDLYE